jgi:hypothetical protein
MLKIMPELQKMCEGPVSSPSSEHLMVDSLVPSTMALESNTPLESSLVATLEESDAPDIAAVQSDESTMEVVHAGADVAVAGMPNLTLGSPSPSSFMNSYLIWILKNPEKQLDAS